MLSEQAAKRVAQGQPFGLDWGAYDLAVTTHLKQAQKKILRGDKPRTAVGLSEIFRPGAQMRPYLCRTLSHPSGKGRQISGPCTAKCPNFPCFTRGRLIAFDQGPMREWDAWAIEIARKKYEETQGGAGPSAHRA